MIHGKRGNCSFWCHVRYPAMHLDRTRSLNLAQAWFGDSAAQLGTLSPRAVHVWNCENVGEVPGRAMRGAGILRSA